MNRSSIIAVAGIALSSIIGVAALRMWEERTQLPVVVAVVVAMDSVIVGYSIEKLQIYTRCTLNSAGHSECWLPRSMVRGSTQKLWVPKSATAAEIREAIAADVAARAAVTAGASNARSDG